MKLNDKQIDTLSQLLQKLRELGDAIQIEILDDGIKVKIVNEDSEDDSDSVETEPAGDHYPYPYVPWQPYPWDGTIICPYRPYTTWSTTCGSSGKMVQ